MSDRDAHHWELIERKPHPGYFGRNTTAEDREERFQTYLERRQPYVDTCEADGRVFWWDNPEKLAELEGRFPGISSTPGEPARRRFFLERYQ